MKRTEPPADLITAAELARAAGLHPQTVARLVRAGKIAPCAMTMSRIRLFHHSAVSAVEFIAHNPKLRSVIY